MHPMSSGALHIYAAFEGRGADTLADGPDPYGLHQEHRSGAPAPGEGVEHI